MNNIPSVTNSAASSSNTDPSSPAETPELTVVMLYALTAFAVIALYYAAQKLRTHRLRQITPQAPEFFRDDVDRRLDEWVRNGGGALGLRAYGQAEIRSFLNHDNSTRLSLFHLDSPTLPRIWSSPLFSRLEELTLHAIYLSELSEDLCDLTSLRHLNIFSRRITALPAHISRLTNLEFLSIIGNTLAAVPPQIGFLTNLQTLQLDGTELSSLPDEIRYLTNLRNLTLVPIRSLPPQVTLLTNLETLEYTPTRRQSIPLSMLSLLLQTREPHPTTLNEVINTIIDSRNPLRASVGAEICQLQNLKKLAFTEITSLPPEIGRMTNLQSLILIGCELISLPPEIGRMTSLTQLYCAVNLNLRELPNEIMDLSSECTVTLSRNSFTPAILNNIRNRTTTPGYQGPRFDISFREINPHLSNDLSVEELLTNLYAEIDETYVPFTNLLEEGSGVNTEALRAWLARLSFMQDYNCGPERKKWLINNVIKYLKLADENESYREVFSLIITEAARTCGDRVAYYSIHLDIAYQLLKIDLRDIKKLADFLAKGVWAMSMLEDIADAKIKKLWFREAIEMRLAYPVMLRERLNLPINVKDMSYFTHSGVSEVDLEEAYQKVSRELADKKAYFKFLVTHNKWQQSLKVNYPSEFAAIEKTRNDQSEQAVTNEDYRVIQEAYVQSLIELTATALNESDGSAASSS